MKKNLLLAVMVIFTQTIFCQNETTEENLKTPISIGFELDALPYLTGGYYASAWLGLDKYQIRIRPIVAQANVPTFMLPNEFQRNSLQVYALVVDRFFKPNYSGFWVAPGVEYWDGEIENQSNQTAQYQEWIFTAGGGCVWKFYHNFYLNPWAAVHLRVAGDKEVNVGTDLYEIPFFTPEASLKLGWYF